MSLNVYPSTSDLPLIAGAQDDLTLMVLEGARKRYKRNNDGPVDLSGASRSGDPGLDLVIAFHADIENSKGTKDMVNRCRKAGVPVGVFA